MVRTLKLTLAYDGSRYQGWQTQRRAAGQSSRSDSKTIQAAIEAAFRKIVQEPVRVTASGRTDAGVHALAQIAHLKTESKLPCSRLLHSVNQLLPHDIAVTAVDEARHDFHARFWRCMKHYRYRVWTAPVVLPFVRPYVYPTRANHNMALMRREARRLVGVHDFRAFARSRPTASARNRDTRRKILSIAISRKQPEIWFDVKGEGFLHTMVRTIVGTLLDVGRGRLPPGTLSQMLRTGERRLAGTVIPASGLTLMSVTYSDNLAPQVC